MKPETKKIITRVVGILVAMSLVVAMGSQFRDASLKAAEEDEAAVAPAPQETEKVVESVTVVLEPVEAKKPAEAPAAEAKAEAKAEAPAEEKAEAAEAPAEEKADETAEAPVEEKAEAAAEEKAEEAAEAPAEEKAEEAAEAPAEEKAEEAAEAPAEEKAEEAAETEEAEEAEETEGVEEATEPEETEPEETEPEEEETVCTCGAEEGQPHAEDCPLYVEPEEYIDLDVSLRYINLTGGEIHYGSTIRIQVDVANAPEGAQLTYKWFSSLDGKSWQAIGSTGDHRDVVLGESNVNLYWKVVVEF